MKSQKNNSNLVIVTAFASLFLMNCNGSNANFNKPAPSGASAQAAAQKAAVVAKEAVADAQQSDISGAWSCDNALSEKQYNSQCRKKDALAISNDMTQIIIAHQENSTAPSDQSAGENLQSLDLSCDLLQTGSLSLTSSVSANDFVGKMTLNPETIQPASDNVSSCLNLVQNRKPIKLSVELALEASDGNQLILTITNAKGDKSSLVYDRISAPNVDASSLSKGSALPAAVTTVPQPNVVSEEQVISAELSANNQLPAVITTVPAQNVVLAPQGQAQAK
jgi:hypothetical protein